MLECSAIVVGKEPEDENGELKQINFTGLDVQLGFEYGVSLGELLDTIPERPRDGFHLYLVRALYLYESNYRVFMDGDKFLVSSHSTGGGLGRLKRTALMIALPRKPARVCVCVNVAL